MSLQFEETLTLSFSEARAGSQWEVTVEYEYEPGYRGTFHEPGHEPYCNVLNVLGKRLKLNPQTNRHETVGDAKSILPFLNEEDIEGLEAHALSHYQGLVVDAMEARANARREDQYFNAAE